MTFVEKFADTIHTRQETATQLLISMKGFGLHLMMFERNRKKKTVRDKAKEGHREEETER
jgi:hypothetical protein